MKAGSWLAVLAFVAVALLVLFVSWWITRWMGAQTRPPDSELTVPPGAPCFAWVRITRISESGGTFTAWALCKLHAGHSGPHDPDA